MSENSSDWYTEWMEHVRMKKDMLDTLSNMWTLPPVGGTSSPSTPASWETDAWPQAPVFASLGKEIGRIVDDKRAKYGPAINVSSELLKLLYPNGVDPSDYWKATLFTRIADKLARIATDHRNDDEDPWADLVGYALIGTDECRRRKQNG